MTKGKESSNKLDVWGNSLLNKLSALTRNRRKREASKKRRMLDKKAIHRQCDQN